MSTSKLIRSKVRGRRRGAAMVEAVVAIPFFIIIFASLSYIVHLYVAKERTIREARQQAWTHALSSCQGGGQTTGGSDPMGDLNANGAGVNDPSIGKYKGQSGGDVTRSMGTAVASSRATVSSDPLIGSIQNQLTITTRIQCNEKAQNGNVLGVLKYAWSAITFL